jgi:von Willebrand factor type A domain/von Willebrand factor type A C-terminal domain
MGQEPVFTVAVDQNPYLTAGATAVEAIAGVKATGAEPGPAGPAAQAAEVVIIDISGSMCGEKLVAAKKAARAALDALRDGTHFALVAGDDRAELVYPRGNGTRMVQVTDKTRAAAKEALRAVNCRGGTDFDPWLLLADRLLATRPDAIRHAVLLTDGHGLLRTALDTCKGHFTCDARGIGGDWSYHQLAKIADALLGTWGIIREPKDMEADFRQMIERAMSKSMAEVFLRVRPSRGARIRRVQQVAPAIVELTDKAIPAPDGRSFDYPLGPWGTEARDYQIGIEVDQTTMAMETNNPTPARAALVSVVTHGSAGTADGEANTLAQASVKVGWTDDLGLSTRIDPVLARYTGQLELSQHVEAGLSALAARDYAAAENHLGAARRQARQFDREETLILLNRIVEVVDEREGTVRIRRNVNNKDVIEAAWSATQTVQVKANEQRKETPAAPERES